MQKEVFERQVARLRATYGDKAYPPERIGIMARAFERVFDDVFVEAIDDVIANCRAAPMLNEINAALNEARDRAQEMRGRALRERADRQLTDGGVGTILQAASAAKGTADPEFVKLCMSVLHKKGEMSDLQWQQACNLLDDTARALPGKKACAKCGNSGICFTRVEGGEVIERCTCPEGDRHPSHLSFPAFDRNSEPIRVPFPRRKAV